MEGWCAWWKDANKYSQRYKVSLMAGDTEVCPKTTGANHADSRGAWSQVETFQIPHAPHEIIHT